MIDSSDMIGIETLWSQLNAPEMPGWAFHPPELEMSPPRALAAAHAATAAASSLARHPERRFDMRAGSLPLSTPLSPPGVPQSSPATSSSLGDTMSAQDVQHALLARAREEALSLLPALVDLVMARDLGQATTLLPHAPVPAVSAAKPTLAAHTRNDGMQANMSIQVPVYHPLSLGGPLTPPDSPIKRRLLPVEPSSSSAALLPILSPTSPMHLNQDYLCSLVLPPPSCPFLPSSPAITPPPPATPLCTFPSQPRLDSAGLRNPSPPASPVISETVSLASSEAVPTTKKQSRNYKTEICRALQETGKCKYGARCQYAHSEEELRPVVRHPLYRTKLCKEYWSGGYCAYGARCGFIHETNDITKSC